jgi:hypothetical protein
MWNTIVNTVTRWIDSLNSTEWFVVLVGVLALGALCLKGFGSRAKY